MLRLLPPAGTPIRCLDLLKAWSKRLIASNNSQTLAERVSQRTSVPHVFLTNSGRTGLTISLVALRELTDEKRNEVIIPAYTCYSVAATIVRAGLKIRLIDVDPETLDYNYDQLEAVSSEKVLAIVGCNLFGLPSEMNRIGQVAKRLGAFAIDDAAQGMGLTKNTIPLGTRGDLGFYSLDRGKNITTFSGGVVLTKSDKIAEILAKHVSSLPTPSLLFEMTTCIKLSLYRWLINPWIYWLPASLPFLGLGQTIYEPEFPLAQLSRFQSILGAILIDRLDHFNRTRRENSQNLAQMLSESDQYKIPNFDSNDCPSYLRLPVICRTREIRDMLIVELRQKGIVASNMYPGTVADIDQIQNYLVEVDQKYDGAKKIVETMLVLPTHPFVRPTDIEKITQVLKDI